MQNVGSVALLIPIVTMVALFTFLSVAVWSEERRKEREAHYRSELMKKMLEQPGPAADRILQMMRDEEVRSTVQKREGRRLGSLVSMAVGVGTALLFWALEPGTALWTVGSIPFLIGAVIFAFSIFCCRPQEPERGQLP
jgi:lipopolysaccharide export LptBFGC system permease protein LptF